MHNTLLERFRGDEANGRRLPGLGCDDFGVHGHAHLLAGGEVLERGLVAGELVGPQERDVASADSLGMLEVLVRFGCLEAGRRFRGPPARRRSSLSGI